MQFHGGRWPAIPGETLGSTGIGPERPRAPAPGSPGRPRPPDPSSVPPFPEAKGVRSGDSDSGPQAEGGRSRSPERNRGGTELARSGVRSARKRSQWLLFSGERAAAQGSCNNRQTRPTIPAGRVSVATESRGRAWRQPWLAREAKTADPFRSLR